MLPQGILPPLPKAAGWDGPEGASTLALSQGLPLLSLIDRDGSVFLEWQEFGLTRAPGLQLPVIPPFGRWYGFHQAGPVGALI